jgi:hypothetical protein
MRQQRRWWLGGVALAMAACTPHREGADIPEELLQAAADTILTPYGQVPKAVWMAPDRWVVVASDWDEAVVADFGAGRVTPLGNGRGRDYDRPVEVFAAGDSIYLSDWGRRRVTIWTREGRLAGAMEIPLELRAGFPKARDAAGHLYFEPPVIAGPDGRGLLDSGLVLRADPGLARFDTVARLAPPQVTEITRDQRRRLERQVFAGQDRWGVLEDGSVWVARLLRNRVAWISPDGQVALGPQLPDPVFEVTPQDREEFLAQFPRELRGAVEGLPFAAIKPPFEGVFTGPDQQVWKEKSRAAVDSVRRMHVVTREGRLARRLVVPSPGRVIAVGPDALLVAEQFRDGVRLLQVPLRAAP